VDRSVARARYRVRALDPEIVTRPHSLASFFSAMARCAALYLRKKRSHALGPAMMVVGPAGGAFIEGSKAQRAQHREP
jgi:hypothetical protein